MDFLGPLDQAYVEGVLRKAGFQVHTGQGGCQENDTKALVDYATSVLRTLSQPSMCEQPNEPSTSQPDANGGECSEAQGLQQQEQQQPAEVNPHILDLHKQVLEKAARVKELRAEVPALISQSVQGEVESLRPLVASIEQLTASTPCREDADDCNPEGQAHQGQPALDGEELQAMLAGTLDKLPALRARLEQTVQRLARITAAVDAEQGRTSPLKTVEKVLLNRPSDDTENMGDQLNCNGDGSQATRRRLAKDLNAKAL
ncbi:hypothetical protein DUNSADRAFT_14971 [Dunaliella salina]|uniref:Uncharacterized protein n=1 Tax=Dunaliella salina TaxID=3046 RepID=A0ABQ7H258_DUNSA|nr:hypothetical protein DUNSADRAFT_14971 [Dunaliella salina]|eukprot:KAF5840947.1 hypothetical protein DUNSADRAFT_14971 [Dunaliella salina]